MKIKSIRIDGYKNLLDTTLEFNKINALIALNNYGKSNLLEAIEFGVDFIQASDKLKNSLMNYKNAVPINNKTANRNYMFEIFVDGVFDNKTMSIEYSFSFEWVKENNRGARIVSEILKIKTEKDSKPTTYINRNTRSSYYKPSKTGRCDKPIKVNNNNLVLNKLNNFDELFYIQIVAALNKLKLDFINLNNIEKYFVPQSVALIDETGSLNTDELPSIGKFFYNLKEQDRNKYDLLISLILDLLPDIEFITPIEVDFKINSPDRQNIPFRVPEKVYDIRVKIKTNNQDTSINNLSEGSKRIFHILSMALIANNSNSLVIAFEELENSIHPALLQKLLMIITDLSEKTQLLITSHSPHLIKYLDIDKIYLGVPNKDGTAYFKKVKKSKQSKLLKYAKDTESSLGDFIFDMLVEGFDDDSFWIEFI